MILRLNYEIYKNYTLRIASHYVGHKYPQRIWTKKGVAWYLALKSEIRIIISVILSGLNHLQRPRRQCDNQQWTTANTYPRGRQKYGRFLPSPLRRPIGLALCSCRPSLSCCPRAMRAACDLPIPTSLNPPNTRKANHQPKDRQFRSPSSIAFADFSSTLLLSAGVCRDDLQAVFSCSKIIPTSHATFSSFLSQKSL